MDRLILAGAKEGREKSDDAAGQADFREGRTAFMEKRTPKFPYR
jgi:enoyl-CoA hydratase/carnithine racemase